MEITMTLNVTPEQAAEIAHLLADTEPANRTALTAPFDTPMPATPQQNPTAPQTMPAAIPVSTTAPIPAAAPVAPTNAVGAPAPQQAPPIQQGIPTQVPTYTVQDLALACRPLMEAGKQAELQALLAEFGAPAGISSIPENRRAEFAGRLRQMGGQI